MYKQSDAEREDVKRYREEKERRELVMKSKRWYRGLQVLAIIWFMIMPFYNFNKFAPDIDLAVQHIIGNAIILVIVFLLIKKAIFHIYFGNMTK